MAPLTSQDIHLLSRDEDKDAATFGGRWNEKWTIGQVPQGGYSLSLLIQAAQYWVRLPSSHAHPTAAPHVDPLHVSATYVIPATLKKPFRIVVTPHKRGKGVSLVEVRLLQPQSTDDGEDLEKWNLILLAQLFLNNFAARGQEGAPISGPSLSADSPHLTRCGLTDAREVMASTKPRPGLPKMHFRDISMSYPDREFNRRSVEERGPGTNGAAGFWHELDRRDEQDGLAKGREHGVGYNWIALACDLFVFPMAQFRLEKSEDDVWSPTLSLSVEFKRRIPHDFLISRWGHVSRNGFLREGQYDNSCEIWTHPDDNGRLDPPCSPDDGPQILAIARQMALMTALSQQGGDKGAHRKKAARSNANL
ncbi:unnamed protein product [Parajaminaea phylloscopi]